MKYDNNGKNYLIETKYKINDGTLDYLVPSDIKNAAEFVKWLAKNKSLNQDGTKLTIYRCDYIIDPVLATKQEQKKHLFESLNHTNDSFKYKKGVVGKETTRQVVLYVCTKVPYKSDAIAYFEQNGIKAPKMDDCSSDAVIIPWVYNAKKIGLIVNPLASNEYTITYPGYDVLKPEQDVVVNLKIKEIWPNNNNKIPVALRKLFARQK